MSAEPSISDKKFCRYSLLSSAQHAFAIGRSAYEWEEEAKERFAWAVGQLGEKEMYHLVMYVWRIGPLPW